MASSSAIPSRLPGDFTAVDRSASISVVVVPAALGDAAFATKREKEEKVEEDGEEMKEHKDALLDATECCICCRVLPPSEMAKLACTCTSQLCLRCVADIKSRSANERSFACPTCRREIDKAAPVRLTDYVRDLVGTQLDADRRRQIAAQCLGERFDELYRHELDLQVAMARDLKSLIARMQSADMRVLLTDLPGDAPTPVRVAAGAIVDGLPAHIQRLSDLIGYSQAWTSQVKPLRAEIEPALAAGKYGLFAALVRAILDRLAAFERKIAASQRASQPIEAHAAVLVPYWTGLCQNKASQYSVGKRTALVGVGVLAVGVLAMVFGGPIVLAVGALVHATGSGPLIIGGCVATCLLRRQMRATIAKRDTATSFVSRYITDVTESVAALKTLLVTAVEQVGAVKRHSYDPQLLPFEMRGNADLVCVQLDGVLIAAAKNLVACSNAVPKPVDAIVVAAS